MAVKRRSQYDALHDRHHRVLTTKAGTRYERLAALVFKMLHREDVVIHDLMLTGGSEVLHQIDVAIESNGSSRRLLIECKDFDLSGEKVGLDIVRSFWAVVDDTKPDAAIVVTCSDFTEPARRYAKAKGIKLCVLRAFADADWAGRLRNIKILARYRFIEAVEVQLAISDPRARVKYGADGAAFDLADGTHRAHPVVLVTPGGGPVHINDFVKTALENEERTPGEHSRTISLLGFGMEIARRGWFPVDAMHIRWRVAEYDDDFSVVAAKLAELILQGYGPSDFIFWDDDMRAFAIDEDTGEVSPVDQGSGGKPL